MQQIDKKLSSIYDRLEEHFGDLEWWPAETHFEVIVGAVLVQNTSWNNVSRVMARLKSKKVLTAEKLLGMKRSRLAEIIRPAGFFRLKAERLKNVIRFFYRETSIKELAKLDTKSLRKKILAVNGVGAETADSILVYVLERPVFIASAYARRIFFRHGLIKEEKMAYNEVQQLVHDNFVSDIRKMNQFHAMLVEAGKNFCKKTGKRRCSVCPLGGMKESAEFKRN